MKSCSFGVGEAGRLEARSHAFGGERAAAGRERGVGLDELFVERAELRFAFGSGAAHLGAQKDEVPR